MWRKPFYIRFPGISHLEKYVDMPKRSPNFSTDYTAIQLPIHLSTNDSECFPQVIHRKGYNAARS